MADSPEVRAAKRTARNKAHYAKNREAFAAKNRANYLRDKHKRNAEASRAACRRYALKHPERIKAIRARHYQANLEKSAEKAREWSAKNPTRRRELLAVWRKANPEKAAILNARANALRRARVASVECEPVDRIVVFDRDMWTCGICGLTVRQDEASLDHVVPIAKGGSHTYSNCQTAHLKCNLSKGAKLSEKAA